MLALLIILLRIFFIYVVLNMGRKTFPCRVRLYLPFLSRTFDLEISHRIQVNFL